MSISIESGEKCPICGEAVKHLNLSGREFHEDIHGFDCKICGKYLLKGDLGRLAKEYSIWKGLGNEYKGKEYILSGVTRNSKKKVTITQENITDLIDNAPVPDTLPEMLDQILVYVSRRSRSYGEFVKIISWKDYPLFYAKHNRELNYIIEMGVSNEMGYLYPNRNDEYRLTMKGWGRVDELRRTNLDSRKAFVAMWFNKEEMGSVYEEAIQPALNLTGFNPYKVDEDKRNNEMIDNKIIAKIRSSGLLVADLTGIRGSVCWEAGFAKGLGIEVILTCRKDEDKKKIQIPFDIRQYPIIFWETHEKLQEELMDKIKALGLNTKR